MEKKTSYLPLNSFDSKARRCLINALVDCKYYIPIETMITNTISISTSIYWMNDLFVLQWIDLDLNCVVNHTSDLWILHEIWKPKRIKTATKSNKCIQNEHAQFLRPFLGKTNKKSRQQLSNSIGCVRTDRVKAIRWDMQPDRRNEWFSNIN